MNRALHAGQVDVISLSGLVSGDLENLLQWSEHWQPLQNKILICMQYCQCSTRVARLGTLAEDYLPLFFEELSVSEAPHCLTFLHVLLGERRPPP